MRILRSLVLRWNMPFVYLSAIIGALLVSLHGGSPDDEILEPDLETCLLGRVCVSDKAGGKNVFADCLVPPQKESISTRWLTFNWITVSDAVRSRYNLSLHGGECKRRHGVLYSAGY